MQFRNAIRRMLKLQNSERDGRGTEHSLNRRPLIWSVLRFQVQPYIPIMCHSRNNTINLPFSSTLQISFYSSKRWRRRRITPFKSSQWCIGPARSLAVSLHPFHVSFNIWCRISTFFLKQFHYLTMKSDCETAWCLKMSTVHPHSPRSKEFIFRNRPV